MKRVLPGLALAAILLLAACSGEGASLNAQSAVGGPEGAPAVAASAITEANMDPRTGQVVGARDGHGGHSGYDAPPLAELGGSFQLVEAMTGHPYTDKDLLGGWSLVYFGYMECLEACPIALKTLPVAIDRLQAGGLAAKAVFIDINAPRLDDMTGGLGHGGGHAAAGAAPASGHGHDGKAMTGPEIRRQAMAKWGAEIDPEMIFLSGTRKQLLDANRNFQSRVEAAMLKNAEPIHHINHTTNIYVLDPQGRIAGVLYHSDSVKQMTDGVKEMAKANLKAPSAAPSAAPAPAEAPKAHGSHG